MSEITTTISPDESHEVTKVTRESWKCLIAAFVGWALDAMDWMLLALALPLIAKEFGSGMGASGLLGTMTLLGAAISGLFVGMLADKLGRVKMLMFTMFFYALMTALCGFAQSYLQLLVLRFFTGIGLGGEWGVGAALITETWPSKWRAWATSTVHSGFPVGYGLATLAYMYIAPVHGWRWLFFLGVLPAFVAIWIRLSVGEPAPWKASRNNPNEEQPKLPLTMLFQGVYLKRTIFASIMVGGTLMAYWGMGTWVPSYLVQTKGLDIMKSGSFLLLLNFGGICGHQTFGFLSGRLGRRASLLLGIGSATVATLIYVTIDTPDTLFWFGWVFGWATYGFFGTFGAYLSELYPVEARATGASFTFNTGRAMSMLSPYIIGVTAASYGLGVGLGMTAVFNAIAMLALFMLPETRHLLSLDGNRTNATK